MYWWDGELTDVISGGKAVCSSVCLCILFNAVSFQDYIASVMNAWLCSRGGMTLTGRSLSRCHFIYWKSNIDWPSTGEGCRSTVAWKREGSGDNFGEPYCPPINITGIRHFKHHFQAETRSLFHFQDQQPHTFWHGVVTFNNIKWKRLIMVSLVYLKNLLENIRLRRKYVGNVNRWYVQLYS
jgi:hypothetical protein